jgi:hypothetical protein
MQTINILQVLVNRPRAGPYFFRRNAQPFSIELKCAATHHINTIVPPVMVREVKGMELTRET